MILHIVRDILPRYLVYRSVIQNIDGSMTKINNSHRTDRVRNSVAWEVWHRFHKIASERSLVTVHAKAYKGKGATCDNVKVRRSQLVRLQNIQHLLAVSKNRRQKHVPEMCRLFVDTVLLEAMPS